MLIDLTAETGSAEVMELLGYAVFGDETKAAAVASAYASGGSFGLYGWKEEGALVGLAGIEMTEDGSMEIRHLAVLPENRGRGYARGLLLETMLARAPRYVLAESADETAADFYRALGFMVYSLGVDASGSEWFRCVYEVEEPEEDED